jgi:choline dehydrogenase-like flavoprotein
MEERELRADEALDCDVCIVGSGAAGLTMGVKFARANRKLSVMILEGSARSVRQSCAQGSLELVRRQMTVRQEETCHRYEDPIAQKIYQGNAAGDVQRCDPDFLTRHRVRVLGGTTNCWGGWTRTLQPIDFTRSKIGRPWPIERAALEQAYGEAMYFCSLSRSPTQLDLPLGAYEDPGWFVGKTDLDIDVLKLPANSNVRNGGLSAIGENRDRQDGNLDFQLVWGPEIYSSANVRIIRNSNVRRLAASGGRVTQAEVQMLNPDGSPGPKGTVTANTFVLAAGGIETPRLLLLSGLGDHSGKLGRGLMVHPVTDWQAPPALSFTPTGKATDALVNLYSGRSHLVGRGWPTGVWGLLIPTDAALNNNAIGNFRAMVDLRGGTVNFNWEQAPNDSNSVVLGNGRWDVFGDRALNLTWNMQPIDWTTLDRAAEFTSQALKDGGYATNLSYKRPRVEDLLMGDHPMGTTRMSSAPENGVVDPNCRVHTLPNLYVASSSVFPLGGWSNPTLTIVALAARLAAHIIAGPSQHPSAAGTTREAEGTARAQAGT